MKTGDEGAVGEVLVSTGTGFVGVDYDMEEGEIVEDEVLIDNGNGDFGKQKKLDSDVESGEIETDRYDNTNTEINEDHMDIVGKKLRKLGEDNVDVKRGDEMDWERMNSAESLSNGNCAHKYHSDHTRHHNIDASPVEGSDKMLSNYDYETQGSFQIKSLSSEKRHRVVAHSPSRDKYAKVSSSRNLSKSPDWSRGRSRSRSIFREASVVGTPHKQEDSYYMERRHRSDSVDDRIIANHRDYRHSSRDVVRDTERELKEQVGQSSDQVAATDTVENVDGQAEGADVYVADPSFSVGKSPSQNGLSALERPTGTGGLGEGTPKSERSDDMFCDDIFGESPAGVRKTGKGEGLAVEKSGLHDNWDDAEGYYGYRFGEILDGRYEIIAAHGKGVFSTVVRGKDLKAKPGDPEEVAIKIIRSNETMWVILGFPGFL
ncbi:serine/threonine-protein kinase prpf4B-like [Forsythia ovata]|uniref:Serine/threonine-protein kinase prpf4B-like n=1 Tax=Forsythia ovata TaxID=205694 RepID=A0ABD1W9N9_9LAMI